MESDSPASGHHFSRSSQGGRFDARTDCQNSPCQTPRHCVSAGPHGEPNAGHSICLCSRRAFDHAQLRMRAPESKLRLGRADCSAIPCCPVFCSHHDLAGSRRRLICPFYRARSCSRPQYACRLVRSLMQQAEDHHARQRAHKYSPIRNHRRDELVIRKRIPATRSAAVVQFLGQLRSIVSVQNSRV